MLFAAVQTSLTERAAGLELNARWFDEEVVIRLRAAGDAARGAPDADLLTAARGSAHRLDAVMTEAADPSIELRLRSVI